MPFILMTDSCADMPRAYYEEHRIPRAHIRFSLDGNTYADDAGQSLSYRDFYNACRNGGLPTTSQITPTDYEELFGPYLETGLDVLYLAFSSALSGSCQSAQMAAVELRAKFPDRKIVIVDSLCASLGQGLLLDYAVTLREGGKSLEEVAEWLETNKGRLNHYFTVQDLMHLYRGGRVSRTSAYMGTLIGIKPVLHVDHQGRLIPLEKKRGRKNSLRALVEYMEQNAGTKELAAIAVSHGDCLEDAQYVAEMVKERFTVGRVIINEIGPGIGSHSGVDTVALFFLGQNRLS